MAKAPERRCALCAFFIQGIEQELGSCVRYPPKTEGRDLTGKPNIIYPYVRRADFCGEYVQRDPIVNKPEKKGGKRS